MNFQKSGWIGSPPTGPSPINPAKRKSEVLIFRKSRPRGDLLQKIHNQLTSLSPKPEDNVIRRIFRMVTFEGPIRRMDDWLKLKLKMGLYELKDGEIVSARGQVPRVSVKDILKWRQVFCCMGGSFIVIQFVDGRKVELSDTNGHLIRILTNLLPEKELPWTAI